MGASEGVRTIKLDVRPPAFLIAMLLSSPLPLQAAAIGDTNAGTSENINYEVGWKVSTLMGEPVVSTNIKWTPKEIGDLLPPEYRKIAPELYQPGPARDEALKQLRIYDVKVEVTGHPASAPNTSYSLDMDAGIPGKPGGEGSFNVPGSPNWNGLFRNRQAGYMADMDTAKTIVKNGFVVTGTRVTQASFDTSGLRDWLYRKSVGKYNEAYRNAVMAKLDLAEKAYGLPMQAIRDRINALGANLSDKELNAKLIELNTKLSDPGTFREFRAAGPAGTMQDQAFARGVNDYDVDTLDETLHRLPPPVSAGDRDRKSLAKAKERLEYERDQQAFRNSIRYIQYSYSSRAEERQEAEAFRRHASEQHAAAELDQRRAERLAESRPKPARKRARRQVQHEREESSWEKGLREIANDLNQRYNTNSYNGYPSGYTSPQTYGNSNSGTSYSNKNKAHFKYPGNLCERTPGHSFSSSVNADAPCPEGSRPVIRDNK